MNPILSEEPSEEKLTTTDDKIQEETSEGHDERNSSVREATTIAPIPEGVASIITQTDQYGNAISPSPQVEEPPARKPFIYRIFCCLDSKSSSGSAKSRPEMLRTLSRGKSLNVGTNGRLSRPMLMGIQAPEHMGKKCLALDLDETLVHSSFQPVKGADYIIPVQIEGSVHNVYVLKRPGVDEFLKAVAEHYEVVIYTASLGKYADPLLDKLDPDHRIVKRLFREDCVYHDGHYVKDLSLLNRAIESVIIVDNSPMSYIFHPENAIDCTSFIDSKMDRELWQISDFLIEHSGVQDVRLVCKSWRDWCRKRASGSPMSSPYSA